MGQKRIFTPPTSMLRKQIGQMRKLLGLWSNSKLKDNTQRKANPMPEVKEGRPIFLNQSKGVRNIHVTRRQVVFNRHFTEIVSDVLSDGLKRELHDYGVYITSIETKAWNKGLDIFYYTNEPFNMNLHKELHTMVPKIRYAISELRIIGRTPRVNFVYDKTILLDRTLAEALAKIEIKRDEEDTELTVLGQHEVTSTKDLGSQEAKLISKRFEAPNDMVNTMAGLDYPRLFDEVALKLSKGRGDSVRMVPVKSIITTARPMFRAPSEDNETLDATARIKNMRKFMVSQRKKSEFFARKNRLQELLARDSYTWEWPEESEETHGTSDNSNKEPHEDDDSEDLESTSKN